MPPKGSKSAQSKGEKQERRKRPSIKSQNKAAKRNRTPPPEGEPKSRKARVKPKPVAAATAATLVSEVNNTGSLGASTKERPSKKKWLHIDACGEAPPGLALAVATKPAERASKNNDTKARKKRVRPQLVQVQPDRKSAATSSAPFHQTKPMTTSLAQRQLTPTRQQRWTELTAVGQILADEIDKYGHDNILDLSEGEKRQMNSWSASVQRRIYGTSTLVLENTMLAAELREGQKAVESMRDEMTVLRARTKRVRDEAEQLEGNVEQTMKETSALQGATQFLVAIQSLAKQAME